MAFTARDRKFLAALRVDPDEPMPPATNEELAEAILEKDHLFPESDPTIHDWIAHSEQVEAEAAAYYANWQRSNREAEAYRLNWKCAQDRASEYDRKAVRAENRNAPLRAALFTSMAFSAALLLANIAQWYWRS